MPRGQQAVRGFTRRSALRAQITREMPARRGRPKAGPVAEAGPSWWIALSPDAFYARVAQRVAARQDTTNYRREAQ